MNYENKQIIVSVSGGKDSTAMCLNLFEQGYSKNDFQRVFANTGWENLETYQYLNELEKTIGPITRIQSNIKVKDEDQSFLEEIENEIGASQMVRAILYNGIFPSGLAKYCTRQLKLEPFKKFFDLIDDDYVNVVGIRREESHNRSKMDEWEFRIEFDCWTHRPLIDWTEKDVIDIHHRFNLRPNNLYLNGSHRVGCYPCIYATKSEIKLISPERINLIRKLESYLSEKKNKRVSFFKNGFIDEIVTWSNTTRGGKQFELFSSDKPTCQKWGMCGI
jgi:3'-phosphoadenosine 5'-phosphosulfate sulfotransferase (PAPS reductase)/FAD synthetase